MTQTKRNCDRKLPGADVRHGQWCRELNGWRRNQTFFQRQLQIFDRGDVGAQNFIFVCNSLKIANV